MCGGGQELYGSGQEQVAGCCERDNEPLVSIQCGKFSGCLWYCTLKCQEGLCLWSWLFGWLMLVGWVVSLLFVWLVGLLFGLLVYWLFGWLDFYLVGLLFSWSVG